MTTFRCVERKMAPNSLSSSEAVPSLRRVDSTTGPGGHVRERSNLRRLTEAAQSVAAQSVGRHGWRSGQLDPTGDYVTQSRPVDRTMDLSDLDVRLGEALARAGYGPRKSTRHTNPPVLSSMMEILSWFFSARWRALNIAMSPSSLYSAESGGQVTLSSDNRAVKGDGPSRGARQVLEPQCDSSLLPPTEA